MDVMWMIRMCLVRVEAMTRICCNALDDARIEDINWRTYPSMIAAPAAMARNCIPVLFNSFILFGPVSSSSGITPTVPT